MRAVLPALGVIAVSVAIHAHGLSESAKLAAPTAKPASATADPSTVLTRLLRSNHALVLDEDSGKVLLAKAADTMVPIASLTKLMTAMVVLDARNAADRAPDVLRIREQLAAAGKQG